MTWVIGISVAAFIAMGAPIFVALLVAASLALLLFPGPPLLALQQTIFGGLDAYALLSVPFFIFAGELMAISGIADRLINLVRALFGRLPGSIGIAALGGSTLIGTICGSSAAAVAAVGRNMYPQLIAGGYGQRRAAGIITSSGAIDIVIPPSIAMILYGASAEQSIAKLFIAGIIPGIVMALLMAGYISISAYMARIPREANFRAQLAWTAFKQASWALTMPAFVMVGIYAGFFSPTEAGGFACAYAAFLGFVVYRTVTFRGLLEAAVSSAMMTARIMIVVAAAGVISWVLTVEGIPQALIAATTDAGLSPLGFLLTVNLLLLAIGCVLDPTSAILVLAPLLVPIAVSLGIDPIHFGVVMTVNLAIGMFTPPFGLNIFVAQSVLGVPTSVIYRGVLPYMAVQISALALITLIPALSLWLINGMS
ncbi:TRAP transporter large permease [Nitratireductor basaltis]|uniref:TRAP transporter large permease protein n=1 Tax=Nitratireductor basaltis TaxID=472175 RepID=A0A084U7S3_9HYPH|nr:TRAP transporter large permease [Nitratireductor basaltis]KFB09009.1 TRAP dicarboxylate transporter subunit DctM [Nitratireductor basaltis]